MVIYMNYGTRLKAIREEKNLTGTKVAEILNISQVTYSHYEIQEKIIPLTRLNDLCSFYNISLDYIFSFTDIKQYENSKKEIDKNLVSNRLKEFRKENKLTQIKLANILNIGNGTIAEYERGKNLIATPFLYDICKKYRVSADYLLGKTNEPKKF